MRLRRGLDILEGCVDGWQLPEIPEEEYLRKIAALAGLPYDEIVALAKRAFCRPTTQEHDAHDQFIWTVKKAIEKHLSAESQPHIGHQITNEDIE